VCHAVICQCLSQFTSDLAVKDFMSDPTTLNILRSSSAINPGDPGLTGVIRCVQEIGYGKTDDVGA
jgi:hypothetical protein